MVSNRVNHWNRNTANAGTRGMSSEILQSISWVKDPNLLRTKKLEPITKVIDIAKLAILAKNKVSSQHALATKPSRKQVKF